MPTPVIIAGEVIVGDIDALAGHRACRLQRFREPKVQYLHRAIGSHLDVRWLEIAMDDPLLVRRFERVANLLRDG
jgi:hypothetical protein